MKKYLIPILSLAFTLLPHFAHADITSNLTAQWKYDEGTGTTAADDTGNGHTGTLNAGSSAAGWTSSSQVGPYAVTIPGGSGNGISMSLTLTKPYTYASWIYNTAGTDANFRNLFASGGSAGWWLRFGVITPFGGGFSGSSGTVITANTWHHIAIVVDSSGNLTYYLDGVADGTGTAPNVNPDGMGCDSGTGGECFAGRFDDTRVYSRALSSSDITELYTAGANITSNLFGWWKLDDGSGSTAADSAGSNTGTVTGTPSWSAGHIGTGSFSFDGSTYISTPLFTTGATAVTYSAWVKVNSLVDYQTIIRTDSTNNGDDYSGLFFGGPCCGFNSSGDIVLVINNTHIQTSSSNFPAGVWKYVVGTWDASTGSHIYIDGVQQSTTGTISETSITQNFYPYKIGAGGKSTLAGFLNGSLDDVRIYDGRALSANDVTTLYAYPPTPPPVTTSLPRLILWGQMILKGVMKIN